MYSKARWESLVVLNPDSGFEKVQAIVHQSQFSPSSHLHCFLKFVRVEQALSLEFLLWEKKRTVSVNTLLHSLFLSPGFCSSLGSSCATSLLSTLPNWPPCCFLLAEVGFVEKEKSDHSCQWWVPHTCPGICKSHWRNSCFFKFLFRNLSRTPDFYRKFIWWSEF